MNTTTNIHIYTHTHAYTNTHTHTYTHTAAVLCMTYNGEENVCSCLMSDCSLTSRGQQTSEYQFQLLIRNKKLLPEIKENYVTCDTQPK